MFACVLRHQYARDTACMHQSGGMCVIVDHVSWLDLDYSEIDDDTSLHATPRSLAFRVVGCSHG